MIKHRSIRFVTLSIAIFICGQAAVLAASLPAVISVDENSSIKAVDNRLLGFNYEWTGQMLVVGYTNAAGYDTNVVTALAGLSLPLNRSSGLIANLFNWKGAIGPYEDRIPQKLVDWWTEPRKIGCGPVEWVQMVRAIDPSAHFTWTVNLTNSPSDTADVVEFFTGDGVSNPNGGTNWGALRISYGITNPVVVDVWELGNELDGLENRAAYQNITNYTDLCKPQIAAIRGVQPNAKIAAHAATFSSLADYEEFFGVPWTGWHQNVLREIGDDIDYLVFHSYYNSLPSSHLESDVGIIADDILDITGTNSIKIYISEHAWWPKTNDCPPGTTTQWSDSWYTSYGLLSCLGNGDWITRMMNSPAVESAAYPFCGGLWGLPYKSGGTPPYYTTATFDLYKLLDDAFRGGISIVPVSVSGPNTDRSVSTCLFTAAALTTADGVNLILVNRDTNTARSVDLDFKREYEAGEMTVFTAPDILSYNTASNRPVTATCTQFPSAEALSRVTIPAKSLVVLKMKASVISADFNAYAATNVLSEASSTNQVAYHAPLQDSAGSGAFTVWGWTGWGNAAYSLSVRGDNTNNYLNLYSTRISGNPVAQVSTTAAHSLSESWAVRTRFSVVSNSAANGDAYFGLYAGSAMDANGGYSLNQIISAGSTTTVVALELAILPCGYGAVIRTGTNNILEFWDSGTSTWKTNQSYAVYGLDMTGATQYQLAITTDGTIMKLSLINAGTSALLLGVDSPLSALGSNVTGANTARFSAGDIGADTTYNLTTKIYALSVQKAPMVSTDFNAYTALSVISSNTSSTGTNYHGTVLDSSSAAGTFTVWGWTGNGQYSIAVKGANTNNNYLSLWDARISGNPVAQISTTAARPLSGNWGVTTRFSMNGAVGNGNMYLGLYAGNAMNANGGYSGNQISTANNTNAAAALQLYVLTGGQGCVTRTGIANKMEYWDSSTSTWKTNLSFAVYNLDTTGATQYQLAISTDGTTMKLKLINAGTSASLINVTSSISALGSNITAANTVRFSAGDIGSDTAYGWDLNVYALSAPSAPAASVDFNTYYTAQYVISSNTSSAGANYNGPLPDSTSSNGAFTVWGWTGYGLASYSITVDGSNTGTNYLSLWDTKTANNPLVQVSTTEARSLSENWGVTTRFSMNKNAAGNGNMYFGLYRGNAMDVNGGYSVNQISTANNTAAAAALQLYVLTGGQACVARTGTANKMEYWDSYTSTWKTNVSYAAYGLNVTGTTQYDLSITTDGTDMNLSLINAGTSASVINVDSPLSALGSNIRSANTVRFSAGDIGNDTTYGWTTRIYFLTVHAPVTGGF